MPTVIVIDQKRVVRFADVHPDWLLRTEAEPILEAVSALVTGHDSVSPREPGKERQAQAAVPAE
jgi:hypothetical protein